MSAHFHVSRAQLAAFLKDPQTLRQFEVLFKSVDPIVQDGFYEVFTAAENARSTAQQALDDLRRIADSLEVLTTAPHAACDYSVGVGDNPIPPVVIEREDNLTPPVVIGSLGHQQADNVTISGGTITAALTGNQTTLIATSVTLSNGAAAALGTLANAPSAGNPTKWVAIDDNGTLRYVPAW